MHSGISLSSTGLSSIFARCRCANPTSVIQFLAGSDAACKRYCQMASMGSSHDSPEAQKQPEPISRAGCEEGTADPLAPGTKSWLGMLSLRPARGICTWQPKAASSAMRCLLLWLLCTLTSTLQAVIARMTRQ